MSKVSFPAPPANSIDEGSLQMQSTLFDVDEGSLHMQSTLFDVDEGSMQLQSTLNYIFPGFLL